MPEQDSLALAEFAVPDEVEQARKSTPCIHRIEQDAFVLGHQPDGFPLGFADHRVTPTGVVVIDDNSLRGRCPSEAKDFCAFRRQ